MTHLRRLVSSFLVALLATGAMPLPVRGQTPKQACDDPVPRSCGRARFLGEDRGCACFVCSPETRASRKVVCTRSDADKRALFKAVAATPHPKSSATSVAAPGR